MDTAESPERTTPDLKGTAVNTSEMTDEPVVFIPAVDFPELVFGLAGPIGVDLDYITQTTIDALKSFGYESEIVHLTKLMDDFTAAAIPEDTNLIETYEAKIDAANRLRKKFQAKDIMAALAIGAISRLRETHSKEKNAERRVAWIVRQLKTPEEVSLLRAVYGRQFILISIYGAPQSREDYLVAKIQIRSRGTIKETDARQGAKSLIARDSKEDDDFGQNMTNTFPKGDVFVDSNDKGTVNTSIERFMVALFGSNEISPTRDEYAMYLAKSASLRSCDLSRQVGAAIISKSGEIVSLGSNEVPRAGGGTYWTGDTSDSRDFRQGHDPNDLNKLEVFADLVSRLSENGRLSNELLEIKDPKRIVEKLLDGSDGKLYRSARVMDLIEFGRIIHAEMSAICDAARNGTSVREATLYCTVFPCHLCAKHIVASGIARVVYLEPYPKSYVRQLHGDSIQVEDKRDSEKVSFQPFIGISPFRYRDLFEKGRRKNSFGEAQKWKSSPRKPIVGIAVPSHFAAEKFVISQLAKVIAQGDAKLGNGASS